VGGRRKNSRNLLDKDFTNQKNRKYTSNSAAYIQSEWQPAAINLTEGTANL
jgi:hypothetical protein